MKKLVGFISLLCMLNVVALLGVAAFLWATGRVDKAKVQTIGDLLKHRGTPDKFREKVFEVIEPTTRPATELAAATAPASQPALVEGDQIEPASAAERLEFMRRAIETERLRLEIAAQSLRDQQKLLETKQRDVELAMTKLADDKKAFEQKVAASVSKDDGEGFKKTMALFDTLKPKQVKDLLFTMPPENAAKYLAGMEADRAGKIAGEFKSTDERAFLKGMLDRIEKGTKESGTNSASVGFGTAALSAAGALAPGSAKTGP